MQVLVANTMSSVPGDLAECYEDVMDGDTYPGECRRQTDLELIGNGFGRDVYRTTDGTVLKFARNTSGVKDNRNESQHWEKDFEGTPAEDVFVEVKSYSEDGMWLTMEEVNNLGPEKLEGMSGSEKATLIKSMEDRMAEVGWHCRDFREPNIGLDKGRPVFLDYGGGCRKE